MIIPDVHIMLFFKQFIKKFGTRKTQITRQNQIIIARLCARILQKIKYGLFRSRGKMSREHHKIFEICFLTNASTSTKMTRNIISVIKT